MGGRIQSGPRRYDYILGFFIVMSIVIIAIVVLIPEQVIIDVASSLIEFAVVIVVFSTFRFMFPRDSSNRQRVRTSGHYSSVYIAQNMYCFAVIGTVLILVFYHFAVQPMVVNAVTEYVQQAGQLSGIGVILGALFFVSIMAYQLLQSLSYKQN